MNEPDKANPKTSKRPKRRPAMEPLGWDEIVSQPGMGGYLSFLNGPVPLPHLQGPPTEPAAAPAVFIDTTPGPISTPGGVSPPDVVSDPRIVSTPKSAATPFLTAANPGVVSIPAALAIPRLRIRRCAATHDGHSLGEEVLYQALWKAAHTESATTRTIVIGWRGMSQLCRMTPKNCKINTQRLIRKLALEVLSPYNTPESIGTTYRIYSDVAILQRRRDVGLEWVVRSRGVEFVDPATGISILPMCAHT
jgi:hypothetical protein